ncbi:hypothetical protein EMPG_12914, partial [Blastomyces silverae]
VKSNKPLPHGANWRDKIRPKERALENFHKRSARAKLLMEARSMGVQKERQKVFGKALLRLALPRKRRLIGGQRLASTPGKPREGTASQSQRRNTPFA